VADDENPSKKRKSVRFNDWGIGRNTEGI